MNSDEIKRKLLSNAQEISSLHTRINETARYRSEGQKQRNDWELACREFHSRYDQLAFPGGYGSAFERIISGEWEAIETALCFLECRPYFFRSGYMWKKILRKIKRAHLSEKQAERLKIIVQNYHEWHSSKRAAGMGR
jgi:hypothetical protein